MTAVETSPVLSSFDRQVSILVVDEEEPLAHLLTMALGLEGWQVRVARSGDEALAAIESWDPDIVLLDMMLPDMKGTDVVARMRDNLVETPVVFLTGRASFEDRMAGYAAGGDSYLTKPFGLDEVIRELHPIVRKLGLAPTSRRHADLVLDEATGEVWRAGDSIMLTPMEAELLRILIETDGDPQSVGRLRREVGTRVSRDAVVAMLGRIAELVNAEGIALVHSNDRGEWWLAAS